MTARSNDWIILRTSAGSTIALAEALTDAGLTAWAPVATTTRDAMRTEDGKSPLPKGKGAATITVPILSTFVFAAHDHLADLLAMVDSPALNYRVWDKEQRRMVVRGRPHFSVFTLDGEVPRVPDRHLDPLREIERLAAARASRKRKRGKRGRGGAQFRPGEAVRVPDGPFSGLDGVIIPSQKNGTVRVRFCGGAIEAEIEPWLVQVIGVGDEQPSPGSAAEAA